VHVGIELSGKIRKFVPVSMKPGKITFPLYVVLKARLLVLRIEYGFPEDTNCGSFPGPVPIPRISAPVPCAAPWFGTPDIKTKIPLLSCGNKKTGFCTCWTDGGATAVHEPL